jgi:hypothetical protein
MAVQTSTTSPVSTPATAAAPRGRGWVFHAVMVPFTLLWIAPLVFVLTVAFRSFDDIAVRGLGSLPASFSFDGVIGAFAITNHIFWMALGLGIGAMYVRSLTVYLVREGTLDDYVYLEHGAHYAIGALAMILLVTVRWEIHEVITGLIGVALIGLSFLSSVRHNRLNGGDGGDDEGEKEPPAAVLTTKV